MMSSQYNATDNPLVNKSQILNQQYSQSTVTSRSAMHYVECDPKITGQQGLLYVHSGTRNINLSQDLKLENICNFQISSVGVQASSMNCGELWVTYDCILLKSRKATAGAFASGVTGANNSSTGIWCGDHWSLGSSVSTSLYFGVPVISNTSNLGSLLFNAVGPNGEVTKSIYFPIGFTGDIKIQYIAFGDSTAGVVAPTMTGNNGATVLNMFSADSVDHQTGISTSTFLVGTYWFNIADLGTMTRAYITLSVGTFPANVTAADLYIDSLAYSN